MLTGVVLALNDTCKASNTIAADRKICIGSLVVEGGGVIGFNQIGMTVGSISSTTLLICNDAPHIALVTGCHHIVGVHVCPVEVARLQSLLAFPTILTFVYRVVRSTVVTARNLAIEVVGKLGVGHWIRDRRLVQCPILVSKGKNKDVN